LSSPEIPDKLYFKIGEVSDIVGVEAYVLRFWESEFPALSPKKTESGHRVYRKKDVETVLKIKELLYDKGYTIAGARRRLRSPNLELEEDFPEDVLRKVKRGLRDILTLLNGKT
jgi:DNA-binding transcriptional MerR regulator